VSLGTPATPLTLIDGEERGRHRSDDGVVDVVTTGMDLCDHLQGAGALRHCHCQLRLAAGKAGSVAWPGVTTTPYPARPHSQEGDMGTTRRQHLHSHSPAAVMPVTVHHLDLQPERLRGSVGAAAGWPEWHQGQGWGRRQGQGWG